MKFYHRWYTTYYNTTSWHYEEIKSSAAWLSSIKLLKPTIASDPTHCACAHDISIRPIKVEVTSYLGQTNPGSWDVESAHTMTYMHEIPCLWGGRLGYSSYPPAAASFKQHLVIDDHAPSASTPYIDRTNAIWYRTHSYITTQMTSSPKLLSE